MSPSDSVASPSGRRTLRGDVCNDRQRAKEEAASRESKREWMQANFSNLTGPGVFWRDSCLFSQGQSLRHRLQKQQEHSGVHPVELLQTDPDWSILDWERECGYTCNSTRVGYSSVFRTVVIESLDFSAWLSVCWYSFLSVSAPFDIDV